MILCRKACSPTNEIDDTQTARLSARRMMADIPNQHAGKYRQDEVKSQRDAVNMMAAHPQQHLESREPSDTAKSLTVRQSAQWTCLFSPIPGKLTSPAREQKQHRCSLSPQGEWEREKRTGVLPAGGEFVWSESSSTLFWFTAAFFHLASFTRP